MKVGYPIIPWLPILPRVPCHSRQLPLALFLAAPVTPTDLSGPPEAHRTFQPRIFRPTRLLAGPHLQTIVGSRYLRGGSPATTSIRLDTPDGDFLDLDLGADPNPGAPIVLVLHGLEGSSRRGYVRLVLTRLREKGIFGVGMNFRSCSGVPNLKPRFYHSGETSDLAFVLAWLAARYPGRPIGAIGYSLGGNVLLRFLGEAGDSPPSFLQAAVAISVPYDLTDGTACLERGGMGKVYSGYFLRSLLGKVRAKTEILAPILDLERVFAAKSVRDFDQTVTAPLHGFADAWEYYREASSGPIVSRIRVPTLLIHALDDPFLNRTAIPIRAVEENPWTLGAFVERGGHVGFVEGGSGRTRFWSEEEAVRYLDQLLRRKDSP